MRSFCQDAEQTGGSQKSVLFNCHAILGDNLRNLRLDHNYSQEKLCAELQRRGCDIGRTTYAKYESGELNIRVSVIVELRKIYQCTYDDFFENLDISE